jgi:uncharacterized membrane protein YphA (DoxX/SURF4 family)
MQAAKPVRGPIIGAIGRNCNSLGPANPGSRRPSAGILGAVIALTARFLLVWVLFLAGFSKIADRGGFQGALREFGVPERLVPGLAIFVPVAELATACALLGGSTLPWGAVAAILLLVVFTAAIAVNVAEGRQPDCKCFGGLHKSTTGPRTLVRNLFLVALAGLVLADAWSGSPKGAWAALSDRPAGEAAAALVASALLAVIVARSDLVLRWLHRFGWLRRLRRATLVPIQMRLGDAMARLRLALGRPRRGLPVGSAAGFFYLPTLDGGVLDLDTLLDGDRQLLLLFGDPGSDGWDELLPSVAAWQADYDSELAIAIVSRGTPEQNARAMNGHGPVLLQNHREMLDSYRVDRTPSAVLVTRDQKIGSAPAAGMAEIRELVATTVAGERA